MRRRVAATGLVVALAWWFWPRPQAAAPVAVDHPEVPTTKTTRRPAQAAPEGDLPEQPRERMVHCITAVRPSILHGGTLIEHDPVTLEPIGPIHPTWRDEELIFEPRHADGIATLSLLQYEPLVFAWADGACIDLLDPVPSKVSEVFVTMESLPPLPAGRSRDPMFFDLDCGNETVRNTGERDEGPWRVAITTEGACSIRAMLPFGGRFVYGEPVPVTLSFTRPVEITLPVPVPPEGTAGWDLNEEPGGLRVVDVYPGSPAARAGVVVGDLLLQLDGVPAEELDGEAAYGEDAPTAISWRRDGEVWDATLP